MLEEFLTVNIFSFFLVFARIGTSFLTLPGFSSSAVTVQARLVIALGVSLALTPILNLPGVPPTVPGLFLILTGEIITGAFLGIMGRIVLTSLQTAGTVIAFVSSMANAMIQDPIAEQQSSLIASFLGSLGLVMIFVTDAHHLMFYALADSYSLFVPGQPLPIGDFADFLGRRLADSFRIGLQLASPLVITGMTYYIGLGLLGRLMPSLPLFLFGMPFQIAVQVWVLMLSLSTMMMVFMSYFDETFSAYLVP